MKYIVLILTLTLTSLLFADDKVEVETTRIKANKELPKVLYVVPWKEMESYKNADQKLVLHDFFGDLYDPMLPNETALSDEVSETEKAPPTK